MESAAIVIFHGKVQGVFFRANTRKRAVESGIKGWVRNLPDGSVEALFIGTREGVEEVIEWCRSSQPHARVDDVEIEWLSKAEGVEGFEIRYG